MSTLRSAWSGYRQWVVAIVVCAAAVRLLHIEWDASHFFHPDERAVAFAVQRLSLQPLLHFDRPRWDPDFFAYGSLPIYLAKIASDTVGLITPWGASYDGIIINGRLVRDYGDYASTADRPAEFAYRVVCALSSSLGDPFAPFRPARRRRRRRNHSGRSN